MYFRKTTVSDFPSIFRIYEQSVSFMKEEGNPTQWNDLETLKNHVGDDVNKGISYVLLDEGEIQAVFTLLETPDPTYQTIEGKWMDDSSYFTIHRIAVKEHNRGYASACFRYAYLQNRHIRIDTHEKNLPMRKLIEKEGFTYCGKIVIEDESVRLAYEKVASFSELLLNWYQEKGRKLPWRENPSFYHVYLSEIMLQQTRVETVKGYYERFLKILPTLQELASREEDVVMKLWQGLGYYSRARNLQKGARHILENNFSCDTYEKLLKIPGIGEYTAKAILSIVYNKPYVAVDGNLIRIYSRLCSSPYDSKSKEIKDKCNKYFLSLLEKNPGSFNQALMDLGELICLPNTLPKCEECPLKQFCQSYKEKTQEKYPISLKKGAKKEIDKTVFLLSYHGKYLIRKRPNKGLLASLYEFYNIDKNFRLSEAKDYLETNGFSVLKIHKDKKGKHVFTHLIWKMSGFRVELNDFPKDLGFLLVTKEELEELYSVPSAFKIYLTEILK
ncbi:MAG: NUDIX domain-containing protein [Bacilli bacterium]|nr:NUDIX domain-containing protein [Bacilli bacterium]